MKQQISQSLSELTIKREAHVRSCEENEDRSYRLIASLYSDPSHFVYEILQNSEDAKATWVSFNLTETQLKVTHNGRPFVFHDVKDITTVGSTSKAEDINTIGTFGAGFKSVFAITATPQIHSNPFHFEISDYIIPAEIESSGFDENTHIILPFNHESVDAHRAYGIISNKLENIEPECLLYLTNLEEIQWESNTNKGHYIRDPKPVEGIENTSRVFVIKQKGGVGETYEFIVIQKSVEIEGKNLTTEIAYLIQSDKDKKETITAIKDSRLSVFFPTQVRTGLQFLLQAPYKTTPSRESIPFDDPQNQILTDTLVDLAAESLSIIKEMEFLTADFLNILPISNQTDHILYTSIYKKIKETLKTKPLLPTEDGYYASAQNIALSRRRNIASLLNSADLGILIGVEHWIDQTITYDRTRQIWDYLVNELKVNAVDYRDFIDKLTESFLKGKSDEWMQQLYISLANQTELIQGRKLSRYTEEEAPLRSIPIIRLEDGSHIKPYDFNGNIQVYLPSYAESGFKIVKKVLTESEEALKFLKKLGLKELNRVDEIGKHFIPNYTQEAPERSEEDNQKDLHRLANLWKEATTEERREIAVLLNHVCFVRCYDLSNRPQYQPANHIYLENEDIKTWFDDNNTDSVYLISSQTYEDDLLLAVLIELGLRTEIHIENAHEYKYHVHSSHKIGLNGFNPNFQIHGLQYRLENINLHTSIQLWNILLDHSNLIKGETKSSSNLNELHAKTPTKSISKAGKQILNAHWLFDTDGSLIQKSKSEIELRDLHDDYHKANRAVEELVKALELKLDAIREFEEKTGLPVVRPDQKENWEKFLEEENKKKKKDDDPWVPECAPEQANINQIQETELDNNDLDLTGQVINRPNPEPGEPTPQPNPPEEPPTEPKPQKPKHSKEIGDWGEQYAKRILESRYSDKATVHWLNQKGQTGKGYDFVVKDSDGNEISYYEIKSKTTNKPELIDITKTQWQWAQQLNRDGEGNKYTLLIISNAGTPKAQYKEIQDPVKYWKEGKIQAHPIKIEL